MNPYLCGPLCSIHGDPRDTNVRVAQTDPWRMVESLRPGLQERLEQAEERNRQWFMAGIMAGIWVATAVFALIEVVLR